MSDCGCEGSCPVCRLGEVDDHKCNYCEVEFCLECHGIINEVKSENVLPCKCKKGDTTIDSQDIKLRKLSAEEAAERLKHGLPTMEKAIAALEEAKRVSPEVLDRKMII